MSWNGRDGNVGANEGAASLAGNMGDTSTLDAGRCDGKAAAFEASVEANVEATSCGVDTDVMAGEAIVGGATTESDAGEAIETSGIDRGNRGGRV